MKDKTENLHKILSNQYEDLDSVVDIHEAKLNLMGFFQTLLEICEENRIELEKVYSTDQKINHKN